MHASWGRASETLILFLLLLRFLSWMQFLYWADPFHLEKFLFYSSEQFALSSNKQSWAVFFLSSFFLMTLNVRLGPYFGRDCYFPYFFISTWQFLCGLYNLRVMFSERSLLLVISSLYPVSLSLGQFLHCEHRSFVYFNILTYFSSSSLWCVVEHHVYFSLGSFYVSCTGCY